MNKASTFAVAGLLLVPGIVTAVSLRLQQSGTIPSPLTDNIPSELATEMYRPWPFGYGLASSENLRRSMDWSIGDRALTLRWGEQDPNAPEVWSVVDKIETFGYQITASTSREGGDELYVAGISPNGNTVIEKWTLAPRGGGYHLQTVSGAPAALGIPLPTHQSAELLNGGTYTAASSAGDYPSAVRLTVYAGTDFGIVRTMQVDPEGRALLFITYPDQTLRQIDFTTQPDPTLSVLHTTTEIAELADASRLEVLEHSSEGRKWVIRADKTTDLVAPGLKTILLHDADNDGLLETHSVLDDDGLKAAGYDLTDEDIWTEYFVLDQGFDW